MSDLSNAIRQICDEKNLSYEAVTQTIESALAAAYRKDFGEKNQNIKVEFDPETGKSKVFDVKTVVEDMPPEEPSFVPLSGTTESKEAIDTLKEGNKKDDKKPKKGDDKDDDKKEESEIEEEVRRFNPRTEIQISDAKLIKETAKIGDEIITKLPIPDAYGRMAAQTAKQVIIQKLREAERDMIFNEFKDKEHEVISGVVQRREGRVILVDLGKAVGILPSEEQIYNEQYGPNQRIKVYVKEVNTTPKGPEIILSRTSEEILRKVFYLEIPEISNGLVEIKSVAREAGSRSKVAVASVSDNVDPIGSCVGQRGSRIQTIINELGGEKIDIIEYDEDIKKFIANALSPAKVINVEPNSERSGEKKALVKVAEDQLSLAIGKDGQNVRLAARLTGWKIDIAGIALSTPKDADTPSDKEEDKKEKKEREEIKKEDKEKKEKREKAAEKKKDEKTEKKGKDKEEEVKKDENKKEDKKLKKGDDKDDDKKEENKKDKKTEKKNNEEEKKDKKEK